MFQEHLQYFSNSTLHYFVARKYSTFDRQTLVDRRSSDCTRLSQLAESHTMMTTYSNIRRAYYEANGKHKRMHLLPENKHIVLFLISFAFVLWSLLKTQEWVLDGIEAKTVPTDALFPFEYATPWNLALGVQYRHGMQRILKKLKHIIVDDYITWHAATLRSVYLGFQRPEHVRSLIFRGGNEVSDRISGILHAYFCALMSRRVLLIEMNDPFPLSTAFILGALNTNFTYDPDLFYSDSYELSVSTHHAEHLRHVLGPHPSVVLRAGHEPSMKFLLHDVPRYYPELRYSRSINKLKPFHVEPSERVFFPLVFRALFRASPELRIKIMLLLGLSPKLQLPWIRHVQRRAFTKAMHFAQEPYVSIHARLAPHVRGRYHMGHPIEYTARCMAVIAMNTAQKQGIDPPRFYLASDNSNFKIALNVALKRLHGNSSLVYGTWEVKPLSHITNESEGDYNSFICTFVDLFMLSRGDAIVNMKSGFASLAVWMGSISWQEIFTYDECAHFL